MLDRERNASQENWDASFESKLIIANTGKVDEMLPSRYFLLSAV